MAARESANAQGCSTRGGRLRRGPHGGGLGRLVAVRVALVTAVAVGVLAWMVTPAGAAIVYRCGSPAELCRVNSDGSNPTRLTSDGASAAYHGASINPAGTRMVFSRDTESIFASDGNAQNVVGPIDTFGLFPQISADGTRLVEIRDYGTSRIVCTGAASVGATSDCGGYGLFPAFAPDGQLVASDQASVGSPYLACIYAIGASSSGCTRTLASDPANDLVEPAVSPDGQTLAVLVSPPTATTWVGHLALYDMASGLLLRDLTTGTADDHPVWSPDSAKLAFSRAGSLYTTPASGTPGSERLLVSGGDTPAWGGADILTPNATPTPTTTSGLSSGGGVGGSGAGGSGGQPTPPCSGLQGQGLARCHATISRDTALRSCSRINAKKKRSKCSRAANLTFRRAVALAHCTTMNGQKKRTCMRNARRLN